MQKLNSLKEVHLANNLWPCSCAFEDWTLMHFLLKYNEIPCCPKPCLCQWSQNILEMNCSSKNLSDLPSCLPYEQVFADFSENELVNVKFSSEAENISSMNLRGNEITNIDGTLLLLMRNISSSYITRFI